MRIEPEREGLFDTLDLDTGKYVKTVDMGLQNFITKIDPGTGDKTVDPAFAARPRSRALHLPA